MSSFLLFAALAFAFTRLRANNFHGAARAGRYRKLEAVQLYNRSDQAQTQPQPLGTPAFV
jgi:hypothetical protein